MNKFILVLLLCSSCSTADQRSEKKRMNNNKSSEKIYRLSNEKIYHHEELSLSKRELYPWENDSIFPKITIDQFRCKGSSSHKTRNIREKSFDDCAGLYDHGLPYVDSEEFVYPILITVLNKLQNNLEKKLTITSGHRCPKHNSYVSLGVSKLTRFMIGAKVDFYIEGYETDPKSIVQAIMDLYKADTERYAHFQKTKKDDGSVKWRNKEIIISVEQKGEHTILQDIKHPVISIEVLYDRNKKAPVILDWNTAYHGHILN